MRQWIIDSAWLALGSCVFACAPETPAASSSPAITSPASSLLTPSAAAGRPAPVVTTQPASAAPAATPPTAAPAAAPTAAAPPAAAPMNHEAGHAAGAPAPAQPSAAPTRPAGVGTGGGADAFCAKYELHCHYGQPMRHSDKAACIADFDGNPGQQGCKNMHIDTAIAGTAAACNGMASDFCFSIHCLHAAGLADPTGTTYCK